MIKIDIDASQALQGLLNISQAMGQMRPLYATLGEKSVLSESDDLYALYERFRVTSYKQILAVDFDAAMDFVNEFVFDETQIDTAEMCRVFTNLAMVAMDHAKLLRRFAGIGFVNDEWLSNTHRMTTDAIGQLVHFAHKYNLRNKRGQPMFADREMNFYSGNSISFGR